MILGSDRDIAAGLSFVSQETSAIRSARFDGLLDYNAVASKVLGINASLDRRRIEMKRDDERLEAT